MWLDPVIRGKLGAIALIGLFAGVLGLLVLILASKEARKKAGVGGIIGLLFAAGLMVFLILLISLSSFAPALFDQVTDKILSMMFVLILTLLLHPLTWIVILILYIAYDIYVGASYDIERLKLGGVGPFGRFFLTTEVWSFYSSSYLRAKLHQGGINNADRGAIHATLKKRGDL